MAINTRNTATKMSDLPEGCIAHILSLTTPRDACRLSLISHTFKSAAGSDAVWDKFIPSDIHDILSRSSSSSGSRNFTSKKEFFFFLCDHSILIDDGKKSFSLDKWNGKKCYMIAPRDLTIIWGDTPEYWAWISISNSRFPEVAELLYLWWFEVRGVISTSMLSPNTNYAAYFVFNKRDHSYYGFHSLPVEVAVKLTGDDKHAKNIWLDPRRRIRGRLPCPKRRKDGWFEIELGEYFNKRGDYELEMDLMQVRGVIKSGIVIQGIEIRPKAS